MKIVLDTHVLLWAAATPERLDGFVDLIASSRRLISVASVWELAIKQGLGKIDLGAGVGTWISRAASELAAELLDITAAHASGVERLAPLHRDPFDRLLIATAKAEGAMLLTADRTLAGYGDVIRLIE